MTKNNDGKNKNRTHKIVHAHSLTFISYFTHLCDHIDYGYVYGQFHFGCLQDVLRETALFNKL